ncbi:MAG: immunoglobulin domain-containing protein [Chloroflexota bacterium]
MKSMGTISKRACSRAPFLFLITLLFLAAGAKAYSAGIEIIEQPKELLECEGAKNLKLRVLAKTAEGVVARYQWYKDGKALEGETKSSYKIPEMNATYNGIYRCRVWDASNPLESVETRDAVVYQLGKTSIVRQDTLVVVPFGKEAILTVEAHTKGYSAPFFQQGYQWWRRVEGKRDEKVMDNDQYSGSKTPQLVIKRVDGDEFYIENEGYYCEVDGQCGKVYSDLVHVSPKVGVKFKWDYPPLVSDCPFWECEIHHPDQRWWSYGFYAKIIGVFDSIVVEHLHSPLEEWGGDNIRRSTYTYNQIKALKRDIHMFWRSGIFSFTPTSKHSQFHQTKITFYPNGEVFESVKTDWIFHDLQEITKQPRSQTVFERNNFTLSVEAKCDFPLTYQWYRDGAPLRGQKDKILKIKNAGYFDEGKYWVEVGSKCDTICSDTAVIKVIPPPSVYIIEHPVSMIACEGEKDLKLRVEVYADPGAKPRFQWYKDGAPLAGETDKTLIIPVLTADRAGGYKCRVWEPTTFPAGMYSDSADLKMYGKIVITKQDTLVVADYGGGATLSVESELQGIDDQSHEIKYHWYRRQYGAPDLKLVNNKQYSGVNTPALKIKTVDGLECYLEEYGYFLRISGQCADVDSRVINLRPKVAVYFRYNTDLYKSLSARERCLSEVLDPHKGGDGPCVWFFQSDVYGSFDSAKVEFINNAPEFWGDTAFLMNRAFSPPYRDLDKLPYELIKSYKDFFGIWWPDAFHYDDTLIKTNRPYIRKTRFTFYPGGEVFESRTDTTFYYRYQAIERQPQSAEVAEGSDHTLTVKQEKPGMPCTYQWFRKGEEIPGATDTAYTIKSARAEDAGKYWVKLYSKCGPLGSDVVYITVKPKGIMSAEGESAGPGILSLGPNPASDALEITFSSGDAGPARFKILEASGREVMSFSAETARGSVRRDISRLASGAYLIVMSSGAETYVEKFVVVKP